MDDQRKTADLKRHAKPEYLESVDCQFWHRLQCSQSPVLSYLLGFSVQPSLSQVPQSCHLLPSGLFEVYQVSCLRFEQF